LIGKPVIQDGALPAQATAVTGTEHEVARGHLSLHDVKPGSSTFRSMTQPISSNRGHSTFRAMRGNAAIQLLAGNGVTGRRLRSIDMKELLDHFD
jgi:hypothetical protein